MTPGVEAQRLGKLYRLYTSPARRVLETATLGAVRGHHEFWALRGVDLAIGRGAGLGICGANGAGKSTLLRILSGTTAPTEGRFRTAGRVTSLLDLGAGCHPDMSGRANIVLNGVMLGYTREEMRRKQEEIADFAELGDFLDEPLRTYSSGMAMRLGFSVAMTLDPDVLILDEVFAVGDITFQKKCIDRIYDLKKRNKTILFCSHSLYEIRQLCEEAIWLRNGRTEAAGDAADVTNAYYAFQSREPDDLPPPARNGGAAGEPRIVDARIYRLGTDREVYEIESGDSIEIRVWWANPKPEGTRIHVAAGFQRQDLTLAAGMATHMDGFELTGAEGCSVLELPELQLLSGSFLVPIWLMDGHGVHRYHEHMLDRKLVVRSNWSDVGVFVPRHAWKARELPPPREG